MAQKSERTDVVVEYPNRDKPVVKATKGVVILLLLATAGLMLIITIGGWDAMAGLKAVQIAFMLLFVVLAFYAARWNRGVLPLAAALAIILAIFALVAGPQWFTRDKAGYTQPALDANLVGLLVLLLIPLQVLLIAFAMRGFQQDWHVEVERRVDDDRDRDDHYEDDDYGHEPEPSPA